MRVFPCRDLHEAMWWCGSACVLPGFVEAFYIILLVIRFEPSGGICFRQLCFCSLVWSLWCSICYHLWELCYFWAKCYLSSMALEWAVCIKSYLHTTLGGKMQLCFVLQKILLYLKDPAFGSTKRLKSSLLLRHAVGIFMNLFGFLQLLQSLFRYKCMISLSLIIQYFLICPS